MIALYQFPRCWGLPSMGPYCMKVETYLRMADRPHEVHTGDLRRAPRGQLPYAAIDGRIVGDSEHIVRTLEAEAERPVDAGVDPVVRATARGVARTLEESTVWALRYARFVEPEGWRDTRVVCEAIVPWALRPIAPAMIRRDMHRALCAQGIGRFARDAVYAMAAADLDMAVEVLGDRPYLGGDRPIVADATLFAFVGNFLCETARSPLTDLTLARPTLVAHTERMRARVFPDYRSWVGHRVDDAIRLAS